MFKNMNSGDKLLAIMVVCFFLLMVTFVICAAIANPSALN